MSITERMFRDAPFGSSWHGGTQPSGDCGSRKLPAYPKPPGPGVVPSGSRTDSSYSLSLATADCFVTHEWGGPYLGRLDPSLTNSTLACTRRHTYPPPLLLMSDGIPPGTGIHPERPPAAVASTTHRRRRTRSQIAILDFDLTSALSVAPAPRSWKAAEERVLSEFGGSFQTPLSAEATGPSPHKGCFDDDLRYVWEGLKKRLLLFCDRSIQS